MSIFLEIIAVAFSMFSIIPVPRIEWNEKNMRYTLCVFPLVGVVCALSWWLWAFLAKYIAIQFILRGAIFSLLPIWITGGIHLDGYADTCDALASCGDINRKHEILKDSHCGAFAVIRLCSWFILWFALCCSFEPTTEALCCMGIGFVFSRTLSALAITVFPIAKNSGLIYTFVSAANKDKVRKVLYFIVLILLICLIGLGRVKGIIMAITVLVVFCYYFRVCKVQFGGVSGDLAGWFLQKAELYMLAALVFCQIVEEII